MKTLPIAQQIKIIKDARLKIPVYRAPTEDYNPDKPARFDSHVMPEHVQINTSIGFLLSAIEFLSKELMMQNKVIPRESWRKLQLIRQVVKDSRSVIRRY